MITQSGAAESPRIRERSASATVMESEDRADAAAALEAAPVDDGAVASAAAATVAPPADSALEPSWGPHAESDAASAMTSERISRIRRSGRGKEIRTFCDDSEGGIITNK